jgi:undecaprenyl diphosphate synthase
MPKDRLIRLKTSGEVPRHIAVIMDGNGRWARSRLLPRTMGHHHGMRAVREAVEGCIDAGVQVLTLFVFSDEKWVRPADEVSSLTSLLDEYISRETAELRRNGVKTRVLGDRSRLDSRTLTAIERVERETQEGTRLQLGLCISYSGRNELTRAARLIAEEVEAGAMDPDDISEQSVAERLYTAPWPDPDLLIRTAGEQRISNFLLWQLAYTELYVTSVLWPDFTRGELFEAILDYQARERRFGKVGA